METKHNETKKLCSCGMPQSYPIPHKHDRPDHEIKLQEILEKFKKMPNDICIPFDTNEAIQQIRDAGFIHKSEIKSFDYVPKHEGD